MQLLSERTSLLGFGLTAVQLSQFDQYLQLLVQWNERMNLTAVREPQAMVLRHFYDSLTCVLATGDLNGRRLIDVGTGAGFPGLPLKIMFPELQLTLVESIAKKAQFLQLVSQELGLTAVAVHSERAEQLGQNPAHRQQYDWAVGRGVAEMRILAEYLLPLCQVGGHMLAQKGENAHSETAVAETAIGLLGGGAATFYPVQLAEKETPHFLVCIEKISDTPSKYPRRPGMASKRPL